MLKMVERNYSHQVFLLLIFFVCFIRAEIKTNVARSAYLFKKYINSKNIFREALKNSEMQRERPQSRCPLTVLARTADKLIYRLSSKECINPCFTLFAFQLILIENRHHKRTSGNRPILIITCS